MKKILLGSTSLFAAGLLTSLTASSAAAADGIKLGVGGFFKTAYMVVFDDDDEGELGNERNTDGFFSDAEVHFTGSGVLDNGLEVGARIELEGETAGDQIDEAWIWLSGGFGEVRIGSDDEALANACIVPPGGTGNFSAFSPNQWGSNSGPLGGFLGFASPIFSSNSVCTGVDDRGDAQKIVYITPVFAGFQLTASYTPNSAAETHVDGVGPHLGMPTHVERDSRHNVSAYANYSYEGEGWGLTAGLGGSWEGHVEEGESGTSLDEQDFYQAGLNLTLGQFSIGIVGEYYNDAVGIHVDNSDDELEADVWVVGLGAAYAMDAWAFGLQYSHRENDVELTGAAIDGFETQQDRIVGTVAYTMGPGIVVDAEVGYTWLDTDPEFEEILSAPGADGLDDYQALEIGIGTNITF